MDSSIQEKAIKFAIDGHNILIIGTAGTGKTHLLRKITDELTSKGKRVKICCSTGIACQNFKDASTVHSFLGLCDGRFEPDNINRVHAENAAFNFVDENLNSTDCLIIDECSMISKRTFDTIVKVCNRIKKTPIQMIWSGDFLQLPPVPNHLYMDFGVYCFQSEQFKNVFPHVIKLTEVFRTEDPLLIQSVNELFTGKLSTETLSFIESLKRPLGPDRNDVKLFANNMLVDDYNRSCLLQHTGEVHEFLSTDIGDRSALEKMIVPHRLWLKVGCPVILLQNLSKKLVNGLRGVVTRIETDNLVVDFGTKTGTKIPKVKFTVFDPAKNSNIAEREQIPLKLAYGITIHKAQGMTLERVKIDCRDIFKPGQLAVAMSRATSATGIQIINFHRRYVMKPATVVTEFLDSACVNVLPETDVTDCCSRSIPSESDESYVDLPQQETTLRESTQVQEQNVDDLARQEIETEDLWETEDDFGTVIEAIVSTEGQLDECILPDGLMKQIEDYITIKNEITASHRNTNEIIKNMDRSLLVMFVKKLFVKMRNLAKIISEEKQPITSNIPEKTMNEFQRQVHVYTSGTEYRLNCMLLFENEKEESISDEHYTICYKVLECIKLYFLREKVDLISGSTYRAPQRFVTDSSKARVRYVAGYCIAKLRKKYQARQKSLMFSRTQEGQSSYTYSKQVVQILSLLTEDEQFLKENTSDPESLIDIEQKQQETHGLTNVTDKLYTFFLQLTNESLTEMGNKNFVKYGKDLFDHCQKSICESKKISDSFINLVHIRNQEESVEGFDEVSGATQSVLSTTTITKVFEELVHIYLTILLAQFRKDIKSVFKIEKKMAHRKQIKVTSTASKKRKIESSVSESNVSKETNLPSTSAATAADVDENIDKCYKCFADVNDQWIMCDSCDKWYHRKCAGLKDLKLWNKYRRKNAKWFCTQCS